MFLHNAERVIKIKGGCRLRTQRWGSSNVFQNLKFNLATVSFSVGGIIRLNVWSSSRLHRHIVLHLWRHNPLVRHSRQTASAHHLGIVVGRIHLVNLLLSRQLLLQLQLLLRVIHGLTGHSHSRLVDERLLNPQLLLLIRNSLLEFTGLRPLLLTVFWMQVPVLLKPELVHVVPALFRRLLQKFLLTVENVWFYFGVFFLLL